MQGLRSIFKRFSTAKNEVFPQTLEVLVNTSLELLEAGKAAQAKPLVLRAIKVQPDCVEAWTNLAFAELQLENLQAAVEAAHRAIHIDSSHASAWHNLSQAKIRMEQGQEALECSNRALTLNPGDALFWMGKGEALMLLDRPSEAAACFGKALAIDPGMKAAECNREIALLKASPQRWKSLLVALGIASQYFERKLDERGLTDRVVEYFRGNPAYDRDLVRSFDYFAQVNIQLGNPVILGFCEINCLLVAGVCDLELDLALLCSKRLMEAKEKFGSR